MGPPLHGDGADLNPVWESGGGFVHRPMQQPLPAMFLSGTSGQPTLGDGCVGTCALAEEADAFPPRIHLTLPLLDIVRQLSIILVSPKHRSTPWYVQYVGGPALDNPSILRGSVPGRGDGRWVAHPGPASQLLRGTGCCMFSLQNWNCH